MPPMMPQAPMQRMTPQANMQRNAITNALMKIANPPPQRPAMPQMAAAQMPQQQALGQPNAMPAPPGSMPMGMPQDPQPGQPGAFPTPPTPGTAPSPFTPMTSAPGAGAQQGAAQGMMPPQPAGQTGRGNPYG